MDKPIEAVIGTKPIFKAGCGLQATMNIGKQALKSLSYCLFNTKYLFFIKQYWITVSDMIQIKSALVDYQRSLKKKLFGM